VPPIRIASFAAGTVPALLVLGHPIKVLRDLGATRDRGSPGATSRRPWSALPLLGDEPIRWRLPHLGRLVLLLLA
jgi:hypothetical protein